MITANENTGEHPDSGRLSAFAAEELAEQERTNVLEHLAECGQCRALFALITPEEGPPASVVLSRRARRRF